MPGTRKLGKTTDQRKAMLRQQVTDFLDKGRMETTITRAKEIHETYAKQNGFSNLRWYTDDGYSGANFAGVR